MSAPYFGKQLRHPGDAEGIANSSMGPVDARSGPLRRRIVARHTNVVM
jgi:hypothetical protein